MKFTFLLSVIYSMWSGLVVGIILILWNKTGCALCQIVPSPVSQATQRRLELYHNSPLPFLKAITCLENWNCRTLKQLTLARLRLGRPVWAENSVWMKCYTFSTFPNIMIVDIVPKTPERLHQFFQQNKGISFRFKTYICILSVTEKIILWGP